MKVNQFIVSLSSFTLLLFVVVTGCFATENTYPDLLAEEWSAIDSVEEVSEIVVSDPLEPVNRIFFEFNDGFYEWVLKPVSDGYIWIFPRELRESFGHFYRNIAMPVRLINALLQGDFEKSGTVLKRFVINSTLGVYGFADIAAVEFDITRRRADFGQTLGKWGFGEGIYFCWPILGPSSVRGTVGRVVDSYAHPMPYLHDSRLLDGLYYGSTRVNQISLNPDVYEDVKRYSLDPYVAFRQAYYEYSRALVD